MAAEEIVDFYSGPSLCDTRQGRCKRYEGGKTGSLEQEEKTYKIKVWQSRDVSAFCDITKGRFLDQLFCSTHF